MRFLKLIIIIGILLCGCSLGSRAQSSRNFTLDTTITGFHFEMEYPDGIFYSPAQLDIQAEDPELGILIVPLGQLTDEAARAQLEAYITNMRQDTAAMIDPHREELQFSGYKAFTVTHRLKANGKDVAGYVAVLTGNGTAIMFAAMDNTNGNYLDKFKTTLRSVKLK